MCLEHFSRVLIMKFLNFRDRQKVMEAVSDEDSELFEVAGTRVGLEGSCHF